LYDRKINYETHLALHDIMIFYVFMTCRVFKLYPILFLYYTMFADR